MSRLRLCFWGLILCLPLLQGDTRRLLQQLWKPVLIRPLPFHYMNHTCYQEVIFPQLMPGNGQRALS